MNTQTIPLRSLAIRLLPLLVFVLLVSQGCTLIGFHSGRAIDNMDHSKELVPAEKVESAYHTGDAVTVWLTNGDYCNGILCANHAGDSVELEMIGSASNTFRRIIPFSDIKYITQGTEYKSGTVFLMLLGAIIDTAIIVAIL